MSDNTGGPASEKTLRDEFAGRALSGLLASPNLLSALIDEEVAENTPKPIAEKAYEMASAMLAEKARREAVVQESSTTANSGDTLRRLAADVLPADIRHAAGDEPLGWCAEQVRAHVNTLTERNRELVEALSWVSKMIATTAGHKSKVALTVISREVEAILAKHKGAA